MANLYVTEQGSTIRKTGDRLVILKDKEELLEVHCREIDAVLIFGNVQFTTQAAAEMLEHGIEMALFSRYGKLRGQLTPPKAKNIPLRMRQHDRARDAAFCRQFGQEIVRAKIENSAAVLNRYQSNHAGAFPAGALESLAFKAEGVEKAATPEQLFGLEGSAAADYFGLLKTVLPKELRFKERNRRPPRDPFNAILSLGYVVLANEIQSLVDGIGFDPYIGFLHQVDYARPSLALDLLEEFRAPWIDRFCLRLVNLRTLQVGDFSHHPTRGCRLTQEAKKRYFREYERYAAVPRKAGGDEMPYRNILRRQADRLARALRDGGGYEAYRLSC